MARVSLLEKEQVAPSFREVYQSSEERSQEVLNIVKLLLHALCGCGAAWGRCADEAAGAGHPQGG